METFTSKDNKVYKIVEIEVDKVLRLEEIERQLAELQDEKDKLLLV